MYYDTMKNIVVEDQDAKSEKIYYYMNHIVNALMKLIDDVKYENLMAGTESPIETLLINLVRFFKSYTVDIFDIQHRYVCDLKSENMIKFIDALNYLRKIDQVSDSMKMNHSDVINTLTLIMYPNDFIKLKDRVNYEGTLYIDKDHFYNSTRLKDIIHYVEKFDMVYENNRMMDSSFIKGEITVPDKTGVKMNDKVQMFYTDE